MVKNLFLSLSLSLSLSLCKKTSSLLHYPRKIKFIHSFIHSFILSPPPPPSLRFFYVWKMKSSPTLLVPAIPETENVVYHTPPQHQYDLRRCRHVLFPQPQSAVCRSCACWPYAESWVRAVFDAGGNTPLATTCSFSVRCCCRVEAVDLLLRHWPPPPPSSPAGILPGPGRCRAREARPTAAVAPSCRQACPPR